jgi:hypothetical protein
MSVLGVLVRVFMMTRVVHCGGNRVMMGCFGVVLGCFQMRFLRHLISPYWGAGLPRRTIAP